MYSFHGNIRLLSLFRGNSLYKHTSSIVYDRNYLPYIAIYSYEQKMIFGEDDILNVEYYVTDYFQTEYYVDVRYKFRVIISIGQRQTTLKTVATEVYSGDNICRINVSDLPVGDYWLSLQAIDERGLESMILYNEFRIYTPSVDNSYTVTDSDLSAYNINSNGEYGEYELISIPTENVSDPIAYLTQYSDNVVVDSGKYICYLPDTDNDGYHNHKEANWFKWTAGDYHSFIKYADDYDVDAVEQEAINTTIGLTNLINDKIKDGYNRIILPKGYYRISTQETIEITGNNAVIDFSNSIIKSNKLTKPCRPSCAIYGDDIHVINCNFEGCLLDTDYSLYVTEEDPEARSWCEIGHGISITKCSKYSTFEQCTVKHFNGYGLITTVPLYSQPTHSNWNEWTSHIVLSNKDKWILGDIDEYGNSIPAIDRYLYDKYVDVSVNDAFPYISVNKYLGYQGIHGGSQYLKYHMYDAEYRYLGYKTAMQFRKIWLLENTKYIKIVALTDIFSYTYNDNEYPLTALSITNHTETINCGFKDIIVEDIRCVGATPLGKNCFYDNVRITKSGYAQAHQLLDAEDTWEGLQDFVIKNSFFAEGVSASGLLLCSGVNTIIENTTAPISTYGRARDTVIRNSIITKLNFDTDGRFRTGYVRIYNNTFDSETNGVGFHEYMGSFAYVADSVPQPQIMINGTNTFTFNTYGSTRNKNIVFKNLTFDIPNRSQPGCYADYIDCTINNLNGGVTNIRATRCVFNNGNFKLTNTHNTYYFDNRFINCIFNNCNITNSTDIRDEELFINCTFLN